jgi:hypothetical protein
MNIHLQYLNGSWLHSTAGAWGFAWASECATRGEQCALYSPSDDARVGWIGRE